MKTVPTDELKAAESHIAANQHWFDEVDPESVAPKPSLSNGDSEVFVLAPDQSITLPDSRTTISGPGFIDIGKMDFKPGAMPWYRVYFVQGVDQRGRTVAYDLSAT